MKRINTLPTMFGSWRNAELTETQEKVWYFFWCIWYYSIGAILGKILGWWKYE